MNPEQLLIEAVQACLENGWTEADIVARVHELVAYDRLDRDDAE